MMQPIRAPSPILLELGFDDWQDQLDIVERWLVNVRVTQATFREILETAIPKIGDPHIRDYLIDAELQAREHERKAEELYRTIGRHPATARTTSRASAADALQALSDLDAVLDGTEGPWRDLHQLLIAGVSAMGAFATAEQLGLALGIPELVELAFQVVTEKSTQQLILQEYLVELGTTSILSDRPT